MVAKPSDHAQIEGIKFFDDFFKQLITLSTGSLVVLATFADRFSDSGAPNWLAVVAVICFISTIIGCLVVKFIYGARAETGDFSVVTDRAEETAETYAVFVAGISFLLAIVTLGIYAAMALI